MGVREYIGPWPYRIVLAGGWIDQPFVNRVNPNPPGAMVVVCIEPDFPVMERCGMATSTRRVAMARWPDGIPATSRNSLMRELYHAENAGKQAPSGSQDMAGLLWPGISRLEYGTGDVFPAVLSCVDDEICSWLERVLWLLPIGPRPQGYDPLMQKLEPSAVCRLGRNGFACWDAIQKLDVDKLGRALTDYAVCATAILPCHSAHPALTVDLVCLWRAYVADYPGACYAPGGGYMIVASERVVPGAFQVRVRRRRQ